MNYVEYISKLYRPLLIEKSDKNDIIYLDKNEPPFSAFDIVQDLISDDDIKSLRTYPDLYDLYKKLSLFVEQDIENLLICNGSEQAIEFVFRIFLQKDDEVVFLNPSFAMFDVFAYQQQACIKHINFTSIEENIMEKVITGITHNTKLFVLANPNNPTGTAFNLEELKRIANHTKSTGTIFLLDEAYFHFYNINSISLIEEFSHIIITRTFSKALGIAGARVGYVISNADNIQLLKKLKPIDEINQLSNIIAKRVLDNSRAILERNVTQVNKWKKIFEEKQFKDIRYIHTEGNFILLKSYNYKKHKYDFINKNIIPKMDFSNEFLKDCFRFSIYEDIIMNEIIKILTKE